MKMSILITGVNGFVGNYLFKKFSKNKKFKVYGLVRKKFDNDERIITLDEISKNSIFFKKNRIYCIINAAGKAHIRFGKLKQNRNKLNPNKSNSKGRNAARMAHRFPPDRRSRISSKISSTAINRAAAIAVRGAPIPWARASSSIPPAWW